MDALGALGFRGAPASSGTSVPSPEFNDELYDFLVTAARNGRVVTYTDAGEIVGLTMRNPYHRKRLGQLLGAISEFEADHGRPMLSSIVVNKGSKSVTGAGFHQLGEELRLRAIGEDETSFVRKQQILTFSHWANHDVATKAGHPDSGGAGWRASPFGPPHAFGQCQFETNEGQHCQNLGRYDRMGRLACSAHMRAVDPRPWTGP